MEQSNIVQSYIAIDLEMSGLNPKKDKIIEIGAVRIENGKETGVFSKLIQPGCVIEPRIEKLTTITNEMTANAPYIEDVLPEFLEFERNLPLVAHNIMFDYRFLKYAAVRAGYRYERTGIDTLKLARLFCSELEHKTLDSVCEFLAIPMEHHHRALSDARAAAAIFECLKARYAEQNRDAFTPSALIFSIKKQQLLTKHQKEYLNDLVKCNRIKHTINIERLTRAEASRLTDQWIQQYGKLRQEQKSWKRIKEDFTDV